MNIEKQKELLKEIMEEEEKNLALTMFLKRSIALLLAIFLVIGYTSLLTFSIHLQWGLILFVLLASILLRISMKIEASILEKLEIVNAAILGDSSVWDIEIIFLEDDYEYIYEDYYEDEED